MISIFILLNAILTILNNLMYIYSIRNDSSIYLSLVEDFYRRNKSPLEVKRKVLSAVTYFLYGFITIFSIISVIDLIIGNPDAELASIIFGFILIAWVTFFMIFVLTKVKKMFFVLLMKRELKKASSKMRTQITEDINNMSSSKKILRSGVTEFSNVGLFGYIVYQVESEIEEKDDNEILGMITYIPNMFLEDNDIYLMGTLSFKNFFQVQLAKYLAQPEYLGLIDHVCNEKRLNLDSLISAKEAIIICDKTSGKVHSTGYVRVKNYGLLNKMKILRGINNEKAQLTLDLICDFLDGKTKYEEDDIREVIEIDIEKDSMKQEFLELLSIKNDEFILQPLFTFKYFKED